MAEITSEGIGGSKDLKSKNVDAELISAFKDFVGVDV